MSKPNPIDHVMQLKSSSRFIEGSLSVRGLEQSLPVGGRKYWVIWRIVRLAAMLEQAN